MTYFHEVLTKTDLKNAYRQLALANHPDRGGVKLIMQKINEEYGVLSKGFNSIPRTLNEVRMGNTVYVNKSECVVVEVEQKMFRAKAVGSKREAYFDKNTGYGFLNLNIRARCMPS